MLFGAKCALAVAFVFGVGVEVAGAQPKTADVLAAEGLAAGQRNDFDTAIAKFEKAFETDPKPRYRCNLGTAYYGKSDYGKAHLYLSWCLERIDAAPANLAEVVDFAEAELRKAGMVRVRITATPAKALIKAPGLGPLAAPVTAFLSVGEHQISVSAEGHVAKTEDFTLEVGVDRNLAVTLATVAPDPKVDLGESKPDREPEAIEPDADVGIGSEIVVERKSRWRRPLGYVGAGAAVATLIAAVVLNRGAQSIVDEHSVNGFIPQDQRDRAVLRYNLSLGGFAVAGVFAAGAAVIFALPEKRTTTRLEVAPTDGGAVVGASFSL